MHALTYFDEKGVCLCVVVAKAGMGTVTLVSASSHEIFTKKNNQLA